MTARKKKVEHYLISLPLTEHEGKLRYMHCYLMTTNSSRDMERACNKMLEVAEKTFGFNPLPMFASTGPLDAKYTKIVRDAISEMPEVKESLKTATDFHITAFIPNSEIDDLLTAIH
jgi:hypothetical protein